MMGFLTDTSECHFCAHPVATAGQAVNVFLSFTAPLNEPPSVIISLLSPAGKVTRFACVTTHGLLLLLLPSGTHSSHRMVKDCFGTLSATATIAVSTLYVRLFMSQ
jgi:hypothetical protein